MSLLKTTLLALFVTASFTANSSQAAILDNVNPNSGTEPTATVFNFESKSTQLIFNTVHVSNKSFRRDLIANLGLDINPTPTTCTFSLVQNIAGTNGFTGVSVIHLLIARCAYSQSGGPTYKSAGFYIQKDSWDKARGAYYNGTSIQL